MMTHLTAQHIAAFCDECDKLGKRRRVFVLPHSALRRLQAEGVLPDPLPTMEEQERTGQALLSNFGIYDIVAEDGLLSEFGPAEQETP